MRCRDSGGAVRRCAAIVLVVLAVVGCSRDDDSASSVARPEMCSAVREAINSIVEMEREALSVVGASVQYREMDVRGMTADAFRRQLEEFPGREVHVWMPGEKDWLLVGHMDTNRVSLAKAMEWFAADTNCTMSVPEVFASYVGTREEILPAFSNKLQGEVRAEWFVTKELPELNWLDVSGIDEDILNAVLTGIGVVQSVRRDILQGNMLAAQAKDKQGEEKAIEFWEKAAKENPNDPMLQERIANLNRNARGFLEVDKTLQALKCYETLVLIRPNDATAMHNFGMCLKKIGKLDLAKKVLKRAEKLSKDAEMVD